MEITNKCGDVLSSLGTWKEGFEKIDSKKHWKEEYSAWALGCFFTSGRGEKWLSAIEREIFGYELQHIEGRIEHESKLDRFRGGQRMQDLAIWGKTPSGQSCFIGIEAKVLEPFGNASVYDAYMEGINIRETGNPRSKKAERVCQVTSFLFEGKSPKDEEVRNLRYQLLHYFKDSVLEAPSLKESSCSLTDNRPRTDIILLPVLVFETEHYGDDTLLAEYNKNDYLEFVKALGCERRSVGDYEIYHKKINDRDLFTLYANIKDFK